MLTLETKKGQPLWRLHLRLLIMMIQKGFALVYEYRSESLVVMMI